MSAKKHIPALAAALAAFTLTLATTPAAATIVDQQEKTCPIGGKKFMTMVVMTSTYSFGFAPDGSPIIGAMHVLPVCPDNGLPLYRDFKPEEIPTLEKLVFSPEFKALKQDAAFYRAAWLADKMGDFTPDTRAWYVNMASWRAETAEQKARYQREFATRVSAIPVRTDDVENLWLHTYAANAWRELRDFAAAKQVLDKVQTIGLGGTGPDRTGTDTQEQEISVREAEQLQNLLAYKPRLQAAIARKDASPEPLDLIAPSYAASLCISQLKKTKKMDPLCETPDIKKEIEDMRQRTSKKQK